MEKAIQKSGFCKDCSGCGLCMVNCPTHAITMHEDKWGFLVPVIKKDQCIHCGKCELECIENKLPIKQMPHICYAAVAKNEAILPKSASGGVFSALAVSFLESGGIVYGASLEYENNKLTTKHIRMDRMQDLYKLQGSKYAQSKMTDIYIPIQNDLKENKKVLLSGTPCQVDAVKRYVPQKLQENLFTVDIICHGVPSTKMFEDYICYLDTQEKARIHEIIFRDKQYGWSLCGSIKYRKNHIEHKKKLPPELSSYYTYFLSGETYRSGCYKCQYATKDRVGDITLGDFWGIEKVYPEYLQENGGYFSLSQGVSCVLLNSEKAVKLFDKMSKELHCQEAELDQIAKNNRQLNRPSQHTELRDQLLERYRVEGYKAVDQFFVRSLGIKYYVRKFRLKLENFLVTNQE